MLKGEQSIASNIDMFGEGFQSLLIVGSDDGMLQVTTAARRVVSADKILTHRVDYTKSNQDCAQALVAFAQSVSVTPGSTLVILADHVGACFHRLKNIVNPLRSMGFLVTRAFGRVIFTPDDRPIPTAVSGIRAFSSVAQYAFYQATHGYARAELGFFEFGVFEGKTFTLAYQVMAHLMPRLKFCAFDSFEGIIGSLPEEDFTDDTFFCNERTFRHNCRLAGLAEERINIWPGNFLTDLTPGVKIEGVPEICLVAHIDCDVYAPSKAALDYLTNHLVQGSVLMFDDFNAQGASNKLGERAALSAWLEENPHIRTELWFYYEGMSAAFFVHLDQDRTSNLLDT